MKSLVNSWFIKNAGKETMKIVGKFVVHQNAGKETMKSLVNSWFIKT
jgi:hypothetical protein